MEPNLSVPLMIRGTYGPIGLLREKFLTFTPPESFLSDQFWGIYALIGGVRVNSANAESAAEDLFVYAYRVNEPQSRSVCLATFLQLSDRINILCLYGFRL